MLLPDKRSVAQVLCGLLTTFEYKEDDARHLG